MNTVTISTLTPAIQRTVISLCNIIDELYKKDIELSRITKTASLLLLSGLSLNSIPQKIVQRCISEQKEDGGWVDVGDTMWSTLLLSLYNGYKDRVSKGLKWLKEQMRDDHSWGRSKRDMGRIPVTGSLLYFLPELADKRSLQWLERTWIKECYSITYKASYTLMAFRKNNYQPEDKHLIKNTVEWLVGEQSEDGGWKPWKAHPVESNVLCTGISLIGLLQYPEFVDKTTIERGIDWLIQNQLPNGLWRYHQIEDGASWGLISLSLSVRYLEGR
ncbi:MAG: hypothetical protein ABIF11_08565 [Nitrospirota bacterium]